ncbi:polysaccharide deacetylase family protein [Ancylomarina longa]|uniref:Polysaccharide deacetylase family protein n=1 Tax=Ancylomarina longa TaxID=2487017 RepID=A0A434ATY4_9BACT|nr:polysaccharide deacetylase family protein [Ancylomarina longa]RUT77878.1 polysaccharide deacetylase family protein [Ancylomarina longa]
MYKLRQVLGSFIGLILLIFFKKSALEKFNTQVLSIYFHNPSVYLFKGIVRFLKASGFQFIDQKEYYELAIGNQEVSGRKVFISFDDAWQGNLKLIPILEKYQIPISLFVPVKPVVTGNYWWEYAAYLKSDTLNINAIEDLKKVPNKKRMEVIHKLMQELHLKRSAINLKELEYLHNHPLVTIGSHTYHHPITIQCTNDELDFEYRESKKTLERWLNTSINSFAFPNGDYDARDLNLLREHGYKMAFTTNPNLLNRGSVFEMPRISMNTKGGRYENICRMLGLWHKYVKPIQIRLKSASHKFKIEKQFS